MCGDVFQSIHDRDPKPTSESELAALMERQEWSRAHAKAHTSTEHRQLELSGRFATPEAVVKLAAYGISPVGDMCMDEEVAHAALLAPRCPVDDVETTLKRKW